MVRSVLLAIGFAFVLAGCGRGLVSAVPAGSGAQPLGQGRAVQSTNINLFRGTLWYGDGASLRGVPLKPNSAAWNVDGSLGGIVDPVPVAMTVAQDDTLYQLVVNHGTSWQMMIYAPGVSGPSTPEQIIAGTGVPRQVMLVGDGIDVLSTANYGTAGETSTLWTYKYAAGNFPQPIRTLRLGQSVNDVATDNLDRIYVARRGTAGISVYGPAANGNAAPIRTIVTHGQTHDAIAVAPDMTVYVLSSSPSAPSAVVDVWAPGANGPGPTRKIGPFARRAAGGLTVDKLGNVYVGYSGAGVTSVDMYDPNASGQAAAVRTIATPASTGTMTSIVIGPMIALPATTGTLYVGSRDLVNVYPASSSGAVAPQRQITGFYGHSAGTPPPCGVGCFTNSLGVIGAGANGTLLAIQIYGPHIGGPGFVVDVFGPAANGAATPDATYDGGGSGAVELARVPGTDGYDLAGNSSVREYPGNGPSTGSFATGYSGLGGVAVCPNGQVYVSVPNQNLIAVYPPNPSGTPTPLRTFTVTSNPGALACATDGTLYAVTYAANVTRSTTTLTYSVQEFASGASSPARTLGPFVKNGVPQSIAGIALDPQNELYVGLNDSDANGSPIPGSNSISVFAPGITDPNAPVRTIQNPIPAPAPSSFGGTINSIAIGS